MQDASHIEKSDCYKHFPLILTLKSITLNEKKKNLHSDYTIYNMQPSHAVIIVT